MSTSEPVLVPSGHTAEGGVLVGAGEASKQMLVFEDPQCPYCRQFEDLHERAISSAIAVGDLVVEYRMRCFLGPESVRGDNALALGAEVGRFDELRRALFAAQPPEGTGGFTYDDLLAVGAGVGLVDSHFVSGLSTGRYEAWVRDREATYQEQDPQGTPAVWLDGVQIESGALFDPGAFIRRLEG